MFMNQIHIDMYDILHDSESTKPLESCMYYIWQ